MTKKAKTKSIKSDPNKIAAELDKTVETWIKQQRKKAADREKKLLEALQKIPAVREPEAIQKAPMTMSQVRNIRQQIGRCWSIPAGAMTAKI